ncbi:MAG: hypothetical protein E7420_06050 [Ruminococcaceae bacterium]|nr:hypothetical protein [Oscillospiraceae bacterium]
MKKYLSLLIAASCLLLSGCGGGGSIYSNYRATEHLLLVQALGADTAEDDGVTLSVSCQKLSSDNSGGIISRSAESITRALSSLQDFSADRQLYYSHAEYVLLGEDYAAAGTDNIFDYIARDNQLRLGIYLFVVKGGSAKELICGPGEDSYEVSKTLSSILRDTRTQGGSHVFTARETLRSLSDHGAALVCALRPYTTEDSVFLLEAGVNPVAEGYGILKGGELVGFVPSEISQAANLIMGNMGSAGITLSDSEGGRLSLEYEKGKADIKPRWAADGSLEGIVIKAKLQANLAEPDTDIKHVTDSAFLSQMEDALSRDMEKKISSLLSLSRELDADFLGIKAQLRRSNGENAAALPDSWLKNLEFSVECETKISYTRELGDQMSAEGGGE